MKSINWNKLAELIWHVPVSLVFIWAGVEVLVTGKIRQIIHFAAERDLVGGVLILVGLFYLHWIYREITKPEKKRKSKKEKKPLEQD